MKLSHVLIGALCAALLAGCGSSEDPTKSAAPPGEVPPKVLSSSNQTSVPVGTPDHPPTR